jgi:hypothetical protein
MEFVEYQGGDSRQLRVVHHLTQQHPLGDEADPRLGTGYVLKANLISHFAAKLASALPGHTASQEARGEPAWLQDHHLTRSQQAVIQKHLRNLGGLAGARRCGDDDPAMLSDARKNG